VIELRPSEQGDATGVVGAFRDPDIRYRHDPAPTQPTGDRTGQHPTPTLIEMRFHPCEQRDEIIVAHTNSRTS
jgi:hypothetical protein